MISCLYAKFLEGGIKPWNRPKRAPLMKDAKEEKGRQKETG